MQWQILMTLWTMPCLLEFIECGKITLSHRYRTCFPFYEILTSLWLLTKARFDSTTQMDPGPTTKLLDVAGGTGDIAFRFMNKVCMFSYVYEYAILYSGGQRGPEHWGWCQCSCVRYQQVNAPGLFAFSNEMKNPTSHLRWVNRGQVVWGTPPAYLGLRATHRCQTILLFG